MAISVGHDHPLSQLTAEEIRHAARLIRNAWSEQVEIIYKSITLKEPDKSLVLEYLEAEHLHSVHRPTFDRESFIVYYKKGGDILYEAVVNLTTNSLVYNNAQDRLLHGPGDYEEVERVEKIVLGDPTVTAELAKLNLPDNTAIICEPWIYGSDGINDERRLYQCFMFIRDPRNPTELDSNHYALPLPISPVVDVVEGRVTRVDLIPTGSDNTLKDASTYKVPPPNEYIPEYQHLRADLKPLQIVQPEGASFKVTQDAPASHVIEWQKWHLRLAFNGREGMVLYDVRYDNRPLFYRIALSDMNIPYADPRHPFHKKAAFDLGDAGAGHTANDLQLGCDCLGSIYYISAVLSNSVGDIMEKNNCICIHEQDNGIGWKHTNYRTGRAAVTRGRELVIQSILTVANYEYILAFILNQAGELTYEVRATGILSTQPIDEGVQVPWGTIVHPGVLAASHQHIFSLRLDPMIDGPKNSLVYEEAHAMPYSKELNPHRVGYYTEETSIKQSGGFDLNMATNRVFKIKNTSSLNPINQNPVGYKIMAPDFQKMLADKDSFHHKRAEFADHNIYVTKYRENELYAAGQYTNQSRGGVGVRTWASRKDNVTDDDIVVWVQFGINHVPRIEDFPVMPCEILKVHLKPVNFFDKNPALDVPPSSQAVSKSSLVSAPNHDSSSKSLEAQTNGCHTSGPP